MKGTITKRGKTSWRLKFDVGPDEKGYRKIRYLTVRGKRQDAERELAKQLTAVHEGSSVEPSKLTLAEYFPSHLEMLRLVGMKGRPCGGKTLERYKQLADQQIIPHLGKKLLQKLRPDDVKQWHMSLLRSGGKSGKPLSAQTVLHAHRLLHSALASATTAEITARNVAGAIHPPSVDREEARSLNEADLAAVIQKTRGTDWQMLVSLDLGTGARRGELLALQWGDFDLDAATVKVQRSIEETKSGLRLKAPKSKYGRRTFSLAPSTVEDLRTHLKAQRELRLALGVGRESAETLLFSSVDGALLSPDGLSRAWARFVRAKRLPVVSFHALRHTHASALIANGIDVVTISRRLGHSSPKVTLEIYAHLFQKTDTTAANAIEDTLRGRKGT